MINRSQFFRDFSTWLFTLFSSLFIFIDTLELFKGTTSRVTLTQLLYTALLHYTLVICFISNISLLVILQLVFAVLVVFLLLTSNFYLQNLDCSPVAVNRYIRVGTFVATKIRARLSLYLLKRYGFKSLSASVNIDLNCSRSVSLWLTEAAIVLEYQPKTCLQLGLNSFVQSQLMLRHDRLSLFLLLGAPWLCRGWFPLSQMCDRKHSFTR